MKRQPWTTTEVLVSIAVACIFLGLIIPPLSRHIESNKTKAAVTTPPNVDWDKVRHIHIFGSVDAWSRAGLAIFVEQDAGEGNIDIILLNDCRRIPEEVSISWHAVSHSGDGR